MTQIKRALLAALLLTASACAGSDDAQMGETPAVTEGAAPPTIVIVDLPDADATTSRFNPFEEANTQLGVTTDLDSEMAEDYGDVCECTTQECQDEWVEAVFGCGVCVFVDCADSGRRGACNLCE